MRFSFFEMCSLAWRLLIMMPDFHGGFFQNIGAFFRWIVSKPWAILCFAFGLVSLAVTIIVEIFYWVLDHRGLVIIIGLIFWGSYLVDGSGIWATLYKIWKWVLEFFDILWYECTRAFRWLGRQSVAYWPWIVAFFSFSLLLGFLAKAIARRKAQKQQRLQQSEARRQYVMKQRAALAELNAKKADLKEYYMEICEQMQSVPGTYFVDGEGKRYNTVEEVKEWYDKRVAALISDFCHKKNIGKNDLKCL